MGPRPGRIFARKWVLLANSAALGATGRSDPSLECSRRGEPDGPGFGAIRESGGKVGSSRRATQNQKKLRKKKKKKKKNSREWQIRNQLVKGFHMRGRKWGASPMPTEMMSQGSQGRWAALESTMSSALFLTPTSSSLRTSNSGEKKN